MYILGIEICFIFAELNKTDMEKALESVRELNHEMFELHGPSETHFKYITDGGTETITFYDMFVWNSELDYRRFDEKKNEYEPLIPFLKKEVNRLIDDLVKLKFDV
jgi:hypothetical protein